MDIRNYFGYKSLINMMQSDVRRTLRLIMVNYTWETGFAIGMRRIVDHILYHWGRVGEEEKTRVGEKW